MVLKPISDLDVRVIMFGHGRECLSVLSCNFIGHNEDVMSA